MSFRILVASFWVAFTAIFGSLQAQQRLPGGLDSLITARIDSALLGASDSVQTDSATGGILGEQEALQRKRRLDSIRRANSANDTAVSYQLSYLSTYAAEVNNMLQRLRRGFDTSLIHDALEDINQELELAVKGTLESGRRENMRNLVSTKLLLTNVESNLERWNTQVSSYADLLKQYRRDMLAITSDSVMKKIPADSMLRKEYGMRLYEVIGMTRELDSLLRKSTVRIGILQNRIIKSKLAIDNYIEEINFGLTQAKRNYFHKEYGYLWEPSTRTGRTMKEIVDFSYIKNKLVLSYFMRTTWPLRIFHMLMVVLIAAAAWWAARLMRQKGSAQDLVAHNIPEWLRYPIVCALFIVVVVAQFTYVRPPDVFMAYLGLLLVISYTYLFYRSAARPWKPVWIVFVVGLALANADYLLLSGNRTERWMVLLLAAASLAAVMYAWRVRQHTPMRYEFLKFNLILFGIQELVSIVANVFGRYTLAKNMMASGYFNFLAAVCIMAWIKLLSDFILLNVEAHRRNERLASYFNFKHIQEGTRPVLNILGMIMWVVLFTRNLNFFDPIVETVTEVLQHEFKIGSFSFDLSGILIFFTVLWVSSLLAKAITFILGGDVSQISNIKKSRFGNVLLIVRLAILSLGFVVAVAAAGIPTDRITIILGALGVGIGFGLQNVVNNLVSGVILAFEKPVSVGDQIEVGGRLGKVKEIGIRSSKLATFEGAEVVIPNGDLLSQHLVNWTLSSNHRRVEINVGVKYGSDLNEVQRILQQVLAGNTHVDHFPEPMVLVDKFNNSSIDFRLLFWTDIGGWIETKSTIMLGISAAFQDAGIEIPFPQQDVHVRMVPPAGAGPSATKPEGD